MGLNILARNTMLDHLGGLIEEVSLHSAWPGTAGLNEISGGTPAYERFEVEWEPAADGMKEVTSLPSFNVGGGTTVAFGGLWGGSNFYGPVPLGPMSVPQVAVASPDEDTFFCPDHPFSDGDSVVLFDALGQLPAGFTEGDIYWVVTSAVNDLQLAASDGGPTLEVITAGTAVLQRIHVETFDNQGVRTFNNLRLVT